MDESAFDTNKGNKRVVAVRGSRNLWHSDCRRDFTGYHSRSQNQKHSVL
ncbi:hypothetical protein GQ600_24365 [Phytophthora cactorum]|nr:hypothetical protein GQ600_24365 [Phytophthora cactorum]